MVRLLQALQAFDALRRLLQTLGREPLLKAADSIDPLTELTRRLRATLNPDAPAMLNQGNAIAEGVDAELDELRGLLTHSKEALADIQRREAEATGIPSLKIGFNSVFGYYLEVRNTYRDKAPADWIRKQTLTGAERYITPELKDYEQKIFGAQDRIDAIERRIFDELVGVASRYIPAIRRNTEAAAELDCNLSAALSALEGNYVRPTVDESMELDITTGGTR